MVYLRKDCILREKYHTILKRICQHWTGSFFVSVISLSDLTLVVIEPRWASAKECQG